MRAILLRSGVSTGNRIFAYISRSYAVMPEVAEPDCDHDLASASFGIVIGDILARQLGVGVQHDGVWGAAQTVNVPLDQRERLGRSSDRLDVPEGYTVRDLWLRCTEGHEKLPLMLSALLVAVNGDYADRETVLRAGDEVMFLPPVSGGADRCRLVRDPIDMRTLEAEVAAARHGAVVTFAGVVREMSDSGRPVRYLEY